MIRTRHLRGKREEEGLDKGTKEKGAHSTPFRLDEKGKKEGNPLKKKEGKR